MSYRKRRNQSNFSLTFFLLISCFGILFVGCSSDTQEIPEFEMFTEQDLERAEQLKNEAELQLQKQTSGTIIPTLVGSGAVNSEATESRLEEDIYAALRPMDASTFVVSNDFLNVRSEPVVTAAVVTQLTRGDTVSVVEFIDNAWAKISLDGNEAYVSKRYITKRISEAQLQQDQAQYEGLYYVNFDFLNVRKDPNTDADLIATLPSQAIIKPVSLDNTWARINYEGREGYVSREYLNEFMPNYSVRQSEFDLPLVVFDASNQSVELLLRSIETLKQGGKEFMTLSEFKQLLESQQVQDVRLPINKVALLLIGITPQNVNDVSDAIFASNIRATAFLRSADISIEGITERKIINIQANGLDVQSATHTGDDLRPLTNAQLALELSQSRQLLEEVTGKDVFAIYYPNGNENERIQEYAQFNGYLFGVSKESGISFDRSEFLRLPTIMLTPENQDTLIEVVSGVDIPVSE